MCSRNARLVLVLLSAVACASPDPGAEREDDFLDGSGGAADTALAGSGGAMLAESGGASSGGRSSGSDAAGGAEAVGVGGSEGGEPQTGGGPGAGGAIAGSGGESTSATGGNAADAECPFEGGVTYELNGSGAWPFEVVELITQAMDEATYYYNCYADLEKSITVNYNPGVPTAEANVDGWLSFGADQGYMQVATAMHEIAHTLGVGYYPWTELMEDGRWIGPNVDAFMTSLPAEERDPDEYSQRTYIRGDAQHFWPYGLNQASEYQSEWSLINHVRIVAAIQRDKLAYEQGEL